MWVFTERTDDNLKCQDTGAKSVYGLSGRGLSVHVRFNKWSNHSCRCHPWAHMSPSCILRTFCAMHCSRLRELNIDSTHPAMNSDISSHGTCVWKMRWPRVQDSHVTLSGDSKGSGGEALQPDGEGDAAGTTEMSPCRSVSPCRCSPNTLSDWAGRHGPRNISDRLAWGGAENSGKALFWTDSSAHGGLIKGRSSGQL